MKQTIIEAGYRVTIYTWENDSDNHQETSICGLSESEVKFYVDLCKLHALSDSGCITDTEFGNMYDPTISEKSAYKTALNVMCQKHIKIINKLMYEKYNITQDSVSESVYEHLFYINLSGEDYYTRVFDSILIEYVPEEIKIENVTDKFYDE
jgi:hypothetical protein